LESNASVSGDAVVMGGRINQATDAHIGGDRVAFPPVLFYLPLLLLAGIIVGIIYGIYYLIQRGRDRPYPVRI